MNVKTFQGPSIADTLAKVKQELGSAAVILHTRSFKKRRRDGAPQSHENIVEITAGINVNVQSRKKTLQSAPARARVAAAVDTGDDDSGDSSNTATAVAERHPLPAVAATGRPTSPASPSIPRPSIAHSGNTTNPTTRDFAATMLKEPTFELRNEIAGLRTMVESLLQRTARAGGKPADFPETLARLYTQLLQQQISDEIAYRVVDDVRAELTAEHLANAATVRERLIQKLEQMLPASLQNSGNSGLARPTTGVELPQPLHLIGPTGVGKTTTIAKLAAAFKLRQKQKVGLITIDTYRIAAVDQLRTYANIIGVPLKVVLSPAELVTAMKAMSAEGCDTVLIDTAGRSHADQLKLNELAQFIAAAKPTEVHLVLSSTTTQEAMEAAYERRSFFQIRPGGVDQIIFTKLDGKPYPSGYC